MKLLVALFTFCSISSFAGFETVYNTIIEEYFKENNVDWEKAKEEFFTYSKVHFKEDKSVEQVIIKVRGKKKKLKKGNKEFPELNSNSAPNLKKIANFSKDLFYELEEYAYTNIGAGEWEKNKAEISL